MLTWPADAIDLLTAWRLVCRACIALWKGVREKSEKGDKSYKAGIKAKYEYYCKEAISPPTQTTTTLNPSPVETHATEPGITAGTTVQLYVPTPFSENTHGPGLSDLPGRVFVATALVFGKHIMIFKDEEKTVYMFSCLLCSLQGPTKAFLL